MLRSSQRQMKITDHIQNANGKTLFSFEVIPPQKGTSINDLYKNIDPLMEFKPPFIDVTTSREEYIFIEKEKKQKLTILKKVLGEEVYEKLLQLSNNYGKEIEATMIDLVELNCQPETKQEEVIDDQWK